MLNVETRSGQTIERRLDSAKGYPETPMTEAELAAKFRSLVEPVVAETRANRLWEALSGLAEATGLGPLAALLGAPVAARQ